MDFTNKNNLSVGFDSPTFHYKKRKEDNIVKRKRKEKFIQAITVAAMMAWIITAREVHSLRMQEIIVFVTSTIWLALFVAANRKIWR